MQRFVLLFILLSACGPRTSSTHSESNIIGGHETTAPPYFVALFPKGERTPFCGGVLIAKRTVLTAAHCVVGLAGEIEVRMVTSDLEDLERIHSVDAIQSHPQYHTGKIRHDVAVLYLRSQSQKAQPIAIDSSTFLNSPLSVIGFGSLSAEASTYPTRLQKTKIQEFPRYECQGLGGPFQTIDVEQICAGDSEGLHDSCYGDSGGPLVTESGKLYGLVSWGVSCGRKNTPGVYTRIASYQNWLNNPINTSDVSELIGAVYYFPLILEFGSISRRFTARYQLWRESKTSTKPVKTWARNFKGEAFSVSLIEPSPGRYALELKRGEKTYTSPAPYTEF